MSCTQGTRELSCEDSRGGCAGPAPGGLEGKASEKAEVKLQPWWAGSGGEAAGESWGTGRGWKRQLSESWLQPMGEGRSRQELTHPWLQTLRALKPGPRTAQTLECTWCFPFMVSCPVLLHLLTNAAHSPLH